MLGFLRQMMLAKYFGTGDVVDAYVLAQSIPNILFGGILVAFGASFMPLFSKRYEKDGIESANAYTSRILIILFSLSILVTILGASFSDNIATLMASGLNENALKITSHYLKFTFGYTYFAASAGIYANYLQYKGIFSRQIVGDYIQNLFFISFIWIAYKYNYNYLIIGLFLGYTFRVIFLRFLVHKNGFRIKIQTNGMIEDLNEVKNYAIPIFLSTTANEINAFVDRTLASRLDSGSISSLNYAHQLSTVFMELTITILATVIFPKLVQSYTKGKKDTYSLYVKQGFMICSIIAIPLALLCVSYSRQIIELIFERGAFVSDSTIRTGNAFLFYSIGTFSLAICTYMGKVYYSASDMKTPMICAAIGVVINILGDFILVNIMQANGLALATSIASIINSTLLLILYRKKDKKLVTKHEAFELFKVICASIIIVLIGAFLIHFSINFTPFIRKSYFAVVCIILLILYYVLLKAFKIKELEFLIRRNYGQKD